MSILDYFPQNLVPRPEQAKILTEIEASWASSDVIVCIAPTATGKTEIALTVARWQAARGNRTNVLVPTNILVSQGHDKYPEMTVLHKRDEYPCKNLDHDLICRCEFDRARDKAKHSRIRLMNNWTYMANRLYAPVAIFDEGHQVIDMLNGMKDIELRRSLYKFPLNLKTVADVIEWIQDQPPDQRLSEALRKIQLIDPKCIVVYKILHLRGTSDVVLSVESLTVAEATGALWPQGAVQKVLILSATTGPQDIKELGLDTRRVAYLECSSVIPPERRPFVYQPSYNLAHEGVAWALPVLAKKVEELLAVHPEKGLIHLPYSLAAKLRAVCQHPRLLYHNNKNKAAVLAEFRASPPEEGLVLVASGLYEGLDLPYDAARWQLIGKVPFLSLAEPRIAKKAEEEPDYYAWESIKRVLQAYGRIVRAPDDRGVTYLMDNSFGRLWRDDQYRQKPMFPEFFRAAYQERK